MIKNEKKNMRRNEKRREAEGQFRREKGKSE